MEYAVLIVAAIIVSLLDERIRGKKKLPPKMPNPGRSRLPKAKPSDRENSSQDNGLIFDTSNKDFDLPPLKGAPPVTVEGIEVIVDDYFKEQILFEKEQHRLKWEEERRRLREQREEVLAKAVPNISFNDKPLLLQSVTRNKGSQKAILNPRNIKEAVVLSEIIGKPRAMNPLCRR